MTQNAPSERFESAFVRGTPVRPHDSIAQRLKALRQSRGMSADRLAAEMTTVGIPWDRSIVANFENRRRSGISVEELLALAYVLNVAPVHLLVPVDDNETSYQIVPTSAVGNGRARQWIRGLFPLPSSDRRLYNSYVPEREWVPPGGFQPLPGSLLEEQQLALDDVERRGVRREADDDGR